MATKVSQRSAQTDLGRLWAEAIRDYNARTKEDLSALGARSITEVMRQIDTDMKKFKGFRDDGSKMSSFRSAMGDHLGDFQKCIDGFAAVGAAVSAFPPAMPVGLVFTAASRLISAFAGVRAEYDRVEEFFAYSARFFERLSILEGRAQSGPLAIAIVRIFSMQLSVCGRVRRLVDEKKIKHWLNALWNEVDEELVSAYAAMQESIQELDEAVGFESYSSIKTVQDDVLVNSAKLDELDKKLQSYRENLGKDIQQFYASTLNLQVVVSEGFCAVQYQLSENHAEESALLRQILKHTAKLSKESENDDKKKQARKPKGDIGDRKFQALRELKKFFAENYKVFPSWQDAHQRNLLQEEDMGNAKVKKTAEWLHEHPSFKKWVDRENPLLWLRGAEGTGKSFLAYSADQELRRTQKEHDCFAYFYFKEEHPYQQSMQNAFASAALQIAGSNDRYAEQVAAKIKDKSTTPTETTWQRFFLSMFPSDNKVGSRLFLVFDGLDEAHVQEGGIFTQFLSDLKRQEANVSVFATSRPGETPTLQSLGPLILDITKQEIKRDMKALVKDRLHTLPRVRKFSHKVKKAITSKVVKQADSMLYVEHMLRRFSYIGRERAVSQALENLPPNLHGLYRLLLDECRQNRSNEQYQAMKKLFAWLAFSKRLLSVTEASGLIRLTLPDDTFDIEEEIIGRSSRILELTQARQLEEDAKDDENDDDENDESKDDGILVIDYEDSPLCFQDRSLRQYFKSVSVEDDGTTEFRTPAAAAHLTILQMCVDIMITAAQEPRSSTRSGLTLYAINYWYEHLKELDVETVSSAVVRDVLVILHCITNNKNNVAKLFEELATDTEIYPEPTPDGPTAWFDTLTPWAKKATTLPIGSINDEILDWAVTVNRDNVLLPLAQGHVQNWLDADDEIWIPETFRFVKSALACANRLEIDEDDPLRYINAVTTQSNVPSKDYKALRVTGFTLADYSDSTDDPDRKQTLITEAITQLESAVECMRGDTLDQVKTVYLLAVVYVANDQEAKAIECFDQAYTMLPDQDAEEVPTQQLSAFNRARVEILTEKGDALNTLERAEEALEVFNEARRVQSEEPLDGWMLDSIAQLFEDEEDASKLMEVLRSWTDKERNTWFAYCFEDEVQDESVTSVQRAAKLTGETDLLLEWLTASARNLPPQSLHLFNLRGAIAYIYYPIVGDIDKGKSLRQEILAMKPKPDPEFEDTMNETKTQHQLQLANILFYEFQMTPDSLRKETIMETLRVLPSAHDDNYNMRQSHIGMLRANMLRVMGPAKDYQKHMDELFKNCIDGLEDSVSWNDSPSLRLLAKVLASLDSLQRDAMIAISAQFSVLNRAIHGDGADDKLSESSESLVNMGVAEAECDQATAEEEEYRTASDETLKDTQTDKVSGISEGEYSDRETGEVLDPLGVADRPEPTVEEPAKLDEDLTQWAVGCDGECGMDTLSSWTQPLYYCILCPNTDICEGCYCKRMKQTKGEIEEPWLSFCGAKHHYIKAPMKDWKGIKNGVIRIGEEKIAFKEWLRGLKEERWQRAWEIFWTRQSWLKDIGVEE
ncbi:unnamed protein product [Alternaria alternata]